MTVEAFELLENHLLFIFRNAGPTVPHLQTQLALVPADPQEHRALGIAESVGQEVLQDSAQQFDIAVDAQLAAPDAKLEPLFPRQRLEFGTECVKQLVERERLGVWIDLAVFEAGNIQQIADQLFGRTQ